MGILAQYDEEYAEDEFELAYGKPLRRFVGGELADYIDNKLLVDVDGTLLLTQASEQIASTLNIYYDDGGIPEVIFDIAFDEADKLDY